MNTQDMARFAVAALERPETVRGSFPVVGSKAWNTGELVQLCERCSGKAARVFRVPPFLIKLLQAATSFFEPAVNVAERLAFAEVSGGGQALNASMQPSYSAFGLDESETTDMESYIREYYDTILKRLRELEADLDMDAKKKLPF